MNELFGLSMTYIAIGCFAATALIVGFVAFIAVRNPVMFKMGLRNIPRRKAQTSLIVIGLMLSTLIMSAAFGTGDTLTTSITAEVYSVLGEADEFISWDDDKEARATAEQVIPIATVEGWQKQFANDPDIEAFVPFLSEQLPVQNLRNRLNEASARIVAFRAQDAKGLGGLTDTSGKPVILEPGQVAVNEELAEQLSAQIGDRLAVLYAGKAVELTVTAIVPNVILGGAFDSGSKQGAAVDFSFLSQLTGKGANADGVFVSNKGDAHQGLRHSDAAMARIEPLLEETPYQVEAFKQDGVRFAELIGNAFTTIFVVFGLFSIAAGILLIFLIFIMLAAERKPEMGMARAVGAKRRQIVESFLAEGMGYDLGSAVLGLLAGMAVTAVMVAIIKFAAGDALGLPLAVTFTLRSLVTAFCLGVIATFLVIFIASWRASRLNIVAAIRDLPESRAINPEAETWMGYYRAVLNGVVALSLPLGLSLLIIGPIGIATGAGLCASGLISPWVYLLRGTDLARQRHLRLGEPSPRWPWILGLAIPVIGWLIILPWYWAAYWLVRLTRDRKPSRVPVWTPAVGILIPPAVGLALVVLQDVRVRISWSVGIGAAFGLAGIALIYGGLRTDSAFFYALGVSLEFLWVAVTLRYFRVAERLTFTVTSALLLLYWYLEAPNKLTWLHHDLSGNIEMFFLSGMVMVTCGVFIIVYNADIVLPFIARIFSRYSRIVPALKTGVAYPLTSRFRTGMTMTMIGLIMFALVMNATINKNFSQIFLSEETRGGFDIVLAVNENNRIDSDLKSVLERAESAPDVGAIRGVGEIRVAYKSEAEVENRDGKKHEGAVEPFSRYTVIGVDQAFTATTELPMKFRSAGFESDRAIWDAIARDPSLALLNGQVTSQGGGFGPPVDTAVLKLNPLADGFEPFTLTLRDPGSGKTSRITVIGQLKDSADTFFTLQGSSDGVAGIVTGKQSVLTAYPDSKAQLFYLKLAPGVDAKAYAKQVESSVVQASAESLKKLLDDQQKLSNGFLLVFQGFMGLGLIVGIAALGVVASRAVVERRQQIGMLRAIGYQRSMVALSFLFESGFIAASGILLGLGLGLSLAWVLFTSGSFGEESRNTTFVVPWLEIGVVCAIAFIASMFMTYLPARAASRVPVADALRYE
jgi:ABC-type lipoprotein release transport system permease subunit